MKNKIILLIALFFCSYFLLNDAYAINVRIDPAKIRLSIPPGSSKNGQIKIINTSAEPAKFKIYLEDWKYVEPMDGSKDFAQAGTTPLSAAGWINFTPNEVELPAFASQIISYTVSMPSDATGGHYAVMFFESTLGEVLNQYGKMVSANVRMASLFYIESEGSVKRDAGLENMSLENEKKYVGIKADLMNKGNCDYISTGSFSIIDAEGNVYARAKFNDVYTFPGDRAKIFAKSESPLSEGSYDLIITLQAEGGVTQTLASQIVIGPQGEVREVTQPE